MATVGNDLQVDVGPSLLQLPSGARRSAAVVAALDNDPGNALQAIGTGQQLEPEIAQIINVLLFVIGAIAVIMIILGGIRYVLSNGDSSQITSAKNTVLYSVIGLVVALLAYAIVNFVVAQFA